MHRLKLLLKLVLILTALIFVLSACGSSANNNTPTLVASSVTNSASQNVTNTSRSSSATPSTNMFFTPSTTKTSASNDWERRWLKNIPCQLPCWEGITPGITKAEEALKLFQNNNLVKEPTLSSPSYLSENYLLWSWSASATKRDYPDGGFAVYKANDPSKTVLVIIPKYEATTFTYKEISAAFGEPSHILVTAEHCVDFPPCPRFYFTLVYLNKGLKVKLFLDSVKLKQPAINDQMIFSGIEIFEPGLDGYAKAYTVNKVAGYQVPFEEGKLLVSWQGFKSFEFYCRNLTETGEVEDCSKLLKINP